MPDEVYAHLRITKTKLHLSKFQVVESGRSRDVSYSEMIGYPSVSEQGIRSLAVRLTRRMNMARNPNAFDFEEHLQRNWAILERAQFGDYSDLKHLLSESAIFSPSQLEEILEGPKSDILDRLSRYLSRASPFMI